MAMREETKEEKFWREFWADREGPKKEHGRPVETSEGRPPNVISFEEYRKRRDKGVRLARGEPGRTAPGRPPKRSHT